MLEDGRRTRRDEGKGGTAGPVEAAEGVRGRPPGPSDENGPPYPTLVDRLPIGVYRLGPDGRPVLANAALLRMLGARSLESLRSGETRWPGRDREALESTLGGTDEALGLEGIWTVAAGPIKVRENIRAVRDGAGNVSCYEGTVEDVTEENAASESLRAKAEFLEEMVSNATVGVFVIDEDNRYVLINPECGRIVGLWPDDYTGGEAGLHVHPDDKGKAMAHFIQAISGETVDTELRIEASDGNYRHCRIILSPLSLGGRPSVLGIVTDQTARKQSEEELKQTSRLDPMRLMTALVETMGRRLPPEALEASMTEVQEWFGKLFSSAFEDYMEIVSGYDVPGERDLEGPQLVLRRYLRFASTMLGGLGIRTEPTFNGLEGCFEIIDCPRAPVTGDGHVGCRLCSMMVSSGLLWSGLKGTVEQRPATEHGSRRCRYVVRVSARAPNRVTSRQ